jgi:hypothetical protein
MGAGKDEKALLRHIRSRIDLKNLSLSPEYNYASLPLCVIDSVFSIGVTYASTKRTVRSWCDSQEPAWPVYKSGDSPRHSIGDFLERMEGKQPAFLANGIFNNRQRTSTKSGILKAEAVVRFASALKRAGINDFQDLADPGKTRRAEADIMKIPGQGSGISFKYFLMLGGADNFVKADRMICRFVSDAVERKVQPAEAEVLVIGACETLRQEGAHITPKMLDHGIWNYQRQGKTDMPKPG